MNQKQALQTFGRSGNPMFSDQTFSEKTIDVSLPKMTLQGTVNKVGMSLLLVLLTAAYIWNQYFSYGADAIGALTIGGSLVGFVFALITIFKRTWAPRWRQHVVILANLPLKMSNLGVFSKHLGSSKPSWNDFLEKFEKVEKC